MWQPLKRLFTGRTRAQEQGQEADVGHDPAEATTRATGGRARAEHAEAADAHSTTAPSPNDTFVGRVSGEDSGDAGETGAERRARS